MLPPLDLLIAIFVMILAAACIGIAVGTALRRATSIWATLAAGAGAALLVAHAAFLNGNVQIAGLIGSPDAIVWANFSPIFVAILTAAAWRSMAIRWQRWIVAILLPAIGLVQAYGQLFGRVPQTASPHIANGIHHQSTLIGYLDWVGIAWHGCRTACSGHVRINNNLG